MPYNNQRFNNGIPGLNNLPNQVTPPTIPQPEPSPDLASFGNMGQGYQQMVPQPNLNAYDNANQNAVFQNQPTPYTPYIPPQPQTMRYASQPRPAIQGYPGVNRPSQTRRPMRREQYLGPQGDIRRRMMEMERRRRMGIQQGQRGYNRPMPTQARGIPNYGRSRNPMYGARNRYLG